MRLIFSTPYDVRMHLATLYSVALSDHEVCHEEESYWNHYVSQYESKLGYKIDKDVIKQASKQKNAIEFWASSLQSRPCSARFLIKELVELIWRDGCLSIGEYEKIDIIRRSCGVSVSETCGLIMEIKTRIEAELAIVNIIERGEKDFGKENVKTADRAHINIKGRIELIKDLSRTKMWLFISMIWGVVSFAVIILLCIKLHNS